MTRTSSHDRLLAVPFLILAIAGWQGAAAQNAEIVATLTIDCSTITVQEGQGGDLQWVLSELPGNDRIAPDGRGGAAEVQKVTQALDSLRSGCSSWPLTDTESRCGLQVGIQKDPDLSLALPDELSLPPSAATQVPCTGQSTWYVFGKLLPQEPMSSLRIELTTAGCAPGGEGADPPTVTYSVAKLLQHDPGIGLAPDTPLRVVLGCDAAGARLGDAEQQALLQAAVVVIGMVIEQGFLPGEKVEDLAGPLALAIRTGFTVGKEGAWSIASPQINHPEGSTDWQIIVSGLGILAADATIEVVPGELESRSSQEQRERLQEHRLAVQQRLNDKYRPALAAGQIPTSRRAAADEQQILGLTEVLALVDWYRRDDRLMAAVSHRSSQRELAATGAVGYSPEQSFTGSVTLSASSSLQGVRQSSLSVRGEAGDAYRSGELDLSWQDIDIRHQLQPKLQVAITANRDEQQLLGISGDTGNETEPLALEELDATASFSLEYDSFSANDRAQQALGLLQRRSWFSTNAKLSVQVRETELLPGAQPSAELLDGRIASVMLNLSQSMSFDLARGRSGGLGNLDLSCTLDGERGLEMLGGEYRYDRYALSFSGELLWGAERNRAFLSRYRAGFGAASHGTPVTELFRLGGPGNVRGMEEGEAVGRGLVFDQTTFGINAAFLLQRLGLGGDTVDSSSGGGGMDGVLDTAYLQVFFDRGRVLDSSSMGEILSFNDAAVGYGIGIELRGLPVGQRTANLSIVYARSPDSAVHRSGTVVTAVSMWLGL